MAGLDGEAGTEQMAQMWQVMMSQMTQAGASRMEIAAFSVDVAKTILDTTRNALWPSGAMVPEEADAAGSVASAVVHLGAVRARVGDPEV